jgi:hypothetical protein
MNLSSAVNTPNVDVPSKTSSTSNVNTNQATNIAEPTETPLKTQNI